jgi:hypothetical protein
MTDALFIAEFWSARYPEDNKILGVFSSEELAEATIEWNMRLDCSMHPDYPARYQQKRFYYNIRECELNERII